jgi:hypothetical protein
MILRNANTGEFEVYDIVNNQITTANSLGAVGLDFQVGGFAVDPPTDPRVIPAAADDGVDAIALGADTSQQQFLTTPQDA